MFAPLYKSDSTGNVRIWKIWVEDTGKEAHIYTEYGVIGGKMVKKQPVVVSSGKNIGKANETSYMQQAMSQAQSKWNLKKGKEQYDTNSGNVSGEKGVKVADKKADKADKADKVETVNKAEKAPGSINPVDFRPMLAQTYDPKKTKFPVAVQPKLDGVRCLVHFIENKPYLISRTGKEFHNLNMIRDSLNEMMKKVKGVDLHDVILDGELGSFGLNPVLTFQQVTGLVKRKSVAKTDPLEKHVEYHIYDLYVKGSPSMGFEDRWGVMSKLMFLGNVKLCCKNTVQKVTSAEGIDKALEAALKGGYEGLMVRDPYAPYDANKRSKGLAKYKKFQDAEFKIIGFKSGQGQDTDTVIYTCETPEGKKFEVRPVGTIEHRKELLKSAKDDVGKLLTVKFFEMTNGGVPRFPVGLTIRNYE
jgi:ATP-dependent DNA ligase